MLGAPASATRLGRAGGPVRPGRDETVSSWLVVLELMVTLGQTLRLRLEVVPVPPAARVPELGAGAPAGVVVPPLSTRPTLPGLRLLTAVRL